MKKQEVDIAEVAGDWKYLSYRQQKAIARTIKDSADRNRKKRPVLRLVSTDNEVGALAQISSITR